MSSSDLTPDLGRVRMVEVGEVSVAVREWGQPDGRPLVFLHGLGPTQSAAVLGLAAAPMVDAGFRLVGIDQPGIGASPGSAAQAYDVASLAALVWDVVDACQLDRPVLIGHSWGAAIACQAAAARSDGVAALVLADAGHRDWAALAPELLDMPLEDIVRGGESIRLRAADRAGVAAALDLSVDDPMVDVAMTALVDDGSGGLVSRATGEVLGAAQHGAFRARPSEAWPVIAAAGIPTLLLLATDPDDARTDNERDGARLSEAVPQAEITFVEGSSHQMIADRREHVGSLVAEWLARTLP